MARQVPLTLAKAIAKANMRRAAARETREGNHDECLGSGGRTGGNHHYPTGTERSECGIITFLGFGWKGSFRCWIAGLRIGEVVDDRITDANKFSFSNHSFYQVLNCCPSIQILFSA